MRTRNTWNGLIHRGIEYSGAIPFRTTLTTASATRSTSRRTGGGTISIADVNDTALLVAKEQGRTEHVLVFDDHVDPNAYWPVFVALTAWATGSASNVAIHPAEQK